ncbi:flavin reductase family protein [Pelistega europaea]|uniref:Flavin reductase family protein n=1 Tax=Pelistega europaea TaxID=106147 RepID=A0A7Y4L8M5_9BURK|nr:flavin reductase family protein [Pelistega europaea]NOL48908.1 flavin reductase family protein [Pelistega europaea]
MSIKAVNLQKSYRLLNHGPTVMVSAKHGNVINAMSVAWACALDFAPPKLTVVIDKGAFTRHLIENSGYFAVQVPTAKQASLVLDMGLSRHQNALKMQKVPVFYQEGFDVPLIEGCAAWLVCKLISEPHNQQIYDLFIGEVIGAWADDQVFKDGHWLFDEATDDMKTLHYIAGGQFYKIGEGLKLQHHPYVANE